jgi:thioredoxin 2
MTTDATHIACPHCQTTNRVPSARLAEDPVCGHCGRPLFDGLPFELTDANFDALTKKTDIPVLIDFWAPWCGPCKQMGPQFDQAAKELKGRAMLAKVNSDENPQLARRFGIRSIPTMVRLKNGQEVARQSGAVRAADILAFAR